MKELGIIVSKNGEFKKFGRWKPINKRQEKDKGNWHNEAFMKEVYKTSWFKNLGVTYNKKDYHFQNQLDSFAKAGLVVILNIKYGTNSPGEAGFMIVMPNNITDRQINFFMNNELAFKEHGKGVFSFIDVFNVDEDYDVKEHFYTVDDLYTYLHELKKKSKQKVLSLR